MRFTKVKDTAFKEMQFNAGVLLEDFNPELPAFEVSQIIGATTGGFSFDATPTFRDDGADIDNCPDKTKELMKLDEWEVKASGTFITVNPDLVKSLLAAADVSGDKITPRVDLADSDFTDKWWVGDYSDKTGETNGGFVAIHMINALSTGGFKMKTEKKKAGQFSFEFTAHKSLSAQTVVPFEIYVKAGTAE